MTTGLPGSGMGSRVGAAFAVVGFVVSRCAEGVWPHEAASRRSRIPQMRSVCGMLTYLRDFFFLRLSLPVPLREAFSAAAARALLTADCISMIGAGLPVQISNCR